MDRDKSAVDVVLIAYGCGLGFNDSFVGDNERGKVKDDELDGADDDGVMLVIAASGKKSEMVFRVLRYSTVTCRYTITLKSVNSASRPIIMIRTSCMSSGQ